jgi:hypothetical protein
MISYLKVPPWTPCCIVILYSNTFITDKSINTSYIITNGWIVDGERIIKLFVYTVLSLFKNYWTFLFQIWYRFTLIWYRFTLIWYRFTLIWYRFTLIWYIYIYLKKKIHYYSPCTAIKTVHTKIVDRGGLLNVIIHPNNCYIIYGNIFFFVSKILPKKCRGKSRADCFWSNYDDKKKFNMLKYCTVEQSRPCIQLYRMASSSTYTTKLVG